MKVSLSIAGRAGLAALLSILITSPLAAADSDTSHVSARALDGDTVEVNGTVVDLYGVDAPELGQLCDLGQKAEPCGLLAAFALQKMIDLSIEPVVCPPFEVDGEATGQVCRAGPDDLGHSLLAGGYVTALDEAPPGYRDAEAGAKQAGLGIWRTDFVNPADWREGKRLASERLAGNSSCKIKGIITASGSRVYYVPTDQGYNSVELDPTFGGEMLCSEEVARRDGWRRP